VISWLPIANTSGGTRETLAIVNVHSINFELVLDAFRAQVEGLADVLAGHRGPIIFGGDFNTWNDARDAVLRETTARLGLTEVQLRSTGGAFFRPASRPSLCPRARGGRDRRHCRQLLGP
jgi:endonuclease/exonuclease/phosphatase (EEP) superfamily protein YafD